MTDKLELYKLEYEKAADRYQEIYRSMWTIFSYLTAVSAGILTLGATKIQPSALGFFAALPLLFWYWTTYLPLDRYGNGVAKRLAALETLLNSTFEVRLDHFGGLARNRSAEEPGILWKLAVILAIGEGGKRWEPFKTQVRRARFAITVFLIVLQVSMVLLGVAYLRSGQPLLLAAPGDPIRGNSTVIIR